MLSLKPNPLLAFLLKRKVIPYGRELATILLLWIIALVLLNTSLSGIYFSPTDLSSYIFRFVFMAAFPIIMLVPVLCGMVAAQPNRYTTETAQRELLLLTNISTEDIIWTHILSVLYRLRWELTVVVAVAPMSFIVANLLWAVLQFEFSNTNCVTSLIGHTFCQPPNAFGPTIKLASLSFSLAIVELAVGTLGTILLTTTIGAIFAIYLKNRVMATVSAGGLALFASFLMFAVIVPEIILKSVVELGTDIPTLIAGLLLALLPFILVLGAIRRIRQRVLQG